MLKNKDHLEMSPPGWRKLVYGLHKAISSIYPNYEIIQIKEKFGMLRYYIDFGPIQDDDSLKISDLITAAEKDSMSLCKNCGNRFTSVKTNPNVVKPMGIINLCDQCRG
jgi:hypothetical protein